MIGTIKKIDSLKQSRNKNQIYYRVYFDIENLSKEKREWAKTDLVPTFRNFKKWKELLKVGNVLSGLIMKNSTTVDADSSPRLIRSEEQKKDETINQGNLFK